jgi:hypothetical protein
MNTFDNRQYIIFNVSELSAINFEDVLETSENTLLRSVDGSKTFVKWENEMPECLQNLITKKGPYTHSEILQILETKEWKPNNSLVPYD